MCAEQTLATYKGLLLIGMHSFLSLAFADNTGGSGSGSGSGSYKRFNQTNAQPNDCFVWSLFEMNHGCIYSPTGGYKSKPPFAAKTV